MKRQLLILFSLSAVLVVLPISAAFAADGGGRGGHGGRGVSHGRGNCGGIGGIGGINRGFTALGVGGDYGCGWDIGDLYRQLYHNLPYFALHPPVYYSYPVPRTYGYSPFAYPPGVMTPEVVAESKPVTIVNPFVPGTKPAASQPASDRSASTTSSPEPLVINNPYTRPTSSVAQSGS